MNNENTAIVMTEGKMNYIADMNNREETYCSLKVSDRASQALLFKAMNNPEKRIGDCINMEIRVKDVYAENVDCVNSETGEVNRCPRIVLIDENGVGYQAVSIGMFSAVKKLIQVFGEPTWDDPIPVVVKQVTKGERKMLTLDVQY